MTVFDLLFIVLFFTAIGTLVVAETHALRRRGARALAVLMRLGLSVAAYFAIVVAVSLASPQRYVAIGDDQCSDDWCIAVEGVLRTPVSDGVLYQVNFRLSSRARRVAQRERYVVAYLRDARGRRFDSDPAAAAVPFDVELQPQESVTATRLFTVPADAADVGLVVAREGGVPIPGCCIIADEGSLFHKKTAVKLQ